MTADSKKWHYLALTIISALLRGIKSNHNGDYYWLKCFNSNATKNKLRSHRKSCKDHDYCYMEMTEEDSNILKYDQEKRPWKYHLSFMLT